MRERLESAFDATWADLLRIVGEVREATNAEIPGVAERARRWRRAFDLDEALDLIRAGRDDELRSRLRARLSREAS